VFVLHVWYVWLTVISGKRKVGAHPDLDEHFIRGGGFRITIVAKNRGTALAAALYVVSSCQGILESDFPVVVSGHPLI
jgi:hypothetical protein